MTTAIDKHDKTHLLLLLFLVALYFATLTFSFVSPILAFFMGVTLITIAIAKSIEFENLKLTIFWFPIYVSALQNVGLGLVSGALSDNQLKIFLTFSFLVYCLIFTFLIFRNFPKISINPILISFISTIGYCAFLYFLKGGEPVAALSSLRNITAMYIFYYIGLKLLFFEGGRKLNELGTGASVLIMIVFITGIFERFFFQDFWPLLNIDDLWTKKGLNIQQHGLPGNFFSSEKLNDEHIRRFVSTYADPINLGTNTFFLFLISWYCKKYIMAMICIVISILAVSKGAMLSLMCFIVFFFRAKIGVLVYFLLAPCLIIIGIGFIYWAYINNAHSVIVHLLGFFSSISTLWEKPLGYGLGNVGVLAAQFGTQANEDIIESGIGLIIGQLGLPGLVLFLVFLWNVIKSGAIPFDNSREQILYRSLLVAILLNITFNEVALSPNSCAGYFLLLGILSSQKFITTGNRQSMAQPST